MIEIIHKRKKRFIALIIFIVIGVLIYCSGFYTFIYMQYDTIKGDKITAMYKEDSKRLEYFKKYENELNELANIIKNNNIEKLVKDKNICSTNSIIIEKEKISICILKDITYNKVSSLNQVIELSEKDIDIVLNNFKKLKLERVIYKNNLIIFYLSSTSNSFVSFDYCIEESNCLNYNKFFEDKEGVLKEIVIDKNWSSVYNTIPII